MDELPLAGLHVLEMHASGPVPFTDMQLQAMGASPTPYTIANGWILTDPFPHPGPVLQLTATTP